MTDMRRRQQIPVVRTVGSGPTLTHMLAERHFSPPKAPPLVIEELPVPVYGGCGCDLCEQGHDNQHDKEH